MLSLLKMSFENLRLSPEYEIDLRNFFELSRLTTASKYLASAWSLAVNA